MDNSIEQVSADGQDETQSARRTEVGGGQGQDHANRQTGVDLDLDIVKSEPERDDRTTGAGAIELIGGILTRLLSDKEERIREVQACITWYEEELVKRQAELADLREFAASLQPEAE